MDTRGIIEVAVNLTIETRCFVTTLQSEIRTAHLPTQAEVRYQIEVRFQYNITSLSSPQEADDKQEYSC